MKKVKFSSPCRMLIVTRTSIEIDKTVDTITKLSAVARHYRHVFYLVLMVE